MPPLTREQQKALIWAQVHRKFAYVLAAASGLVILVLLPWGVWWAFTGRRESAIGAFVPVVLLGLITWAALAGARRDTRRAAKAVGADGEPDQRE